MKACAPVQFLSEKLNQHFTSDWYIWQKILRYKKYIFIYGMPQESRRETFPSEYLVYF